MPKQAGYPPDGQTGFSVSNIQTVLKVDSFSVAAWVRLDAVRPQMFLTLGKPNQDFSFYLYKGAVRMLVEGEPPLRIATAKPPQPNVWTHYLEPMTADGEDLSRRRAGGQQAIPLKRTFAHPLTVGVIDGQEERILKAT